MKKAKCDLLSRKGICSAVLRAMRNQQKSISELRGPCTFLNLEYRKIEKWPYFQFYGPGGLTIKHFHIFFLFFS